MNHSMSKPKTDLAGKIDGKALGFPRTPTSVSRLARLRDEIGRGTYRISAEQLAESLVRTVLLDINQLD